MGNPRKGGKHSSNSGTSKSLASVGYRILKAIPTNPEDFMEESDEVNRDTLVLDDGTHIPATEASFEEEATFEDGEEEAPRAPRLMNPYTGDSDEEGEVVHPNPMDAPDIRDASSETLEHRFRGLKSYQKFICNHYRIDENIVLTRTYPRKGDGFNQTRKFGCRPKN